MKDTIIVVVNDELKQYFFTTHHSVPEGLDDNWVPVTSYIPMSVSPRIGLENGIITDKEDYKVVFCQGYKEIDNPDIKRRVI